MDGAYFEKCEYSEVSNKSHTIKSTHRFQYTTCRLQKFPPHRGDVLPFVVVAKQYFMQVSVTVRALIYDKSTWIWRKVNYLSVVNSAYQLIINFQFHISFAKFCLQWTIFYPSLLLINFFSTFNPFWELFDTSDYGKKLMCTVLLKPKVFANV